jgi:hypothetical protein
MTVAIECKCLRSTPEITDIGPDVRSWQTLPIGPLIGAKRPPAHGHADTFAPNEEPCALAGLSSVLPGSHTTDSEESRRRRHSDPVVIG